jgi:hypothetical protein
MQNFLGKDGFLWWVGQVESTDDPLKIGRAKCRIFGWHSESTTDIPTDALPWAQPLLPLNGTTKFSAPLEGEYILGFFADGVSAQMPIMLGAFSLCVPAPLETGKNSTTNSVTTPTSNVNAVSTDLPRGVPINPANATTQKQDVPPRKLGDPTTSRTARGDIANTIIGLINKDTSHACDFRYFINFDGTLGLGTFINPIEAIKKAIKNGKNKAAMAIRMLLSVLTDTLRQVIRALIATANLDPNGTFSLAFSVVKDAIRKVNEWTKKIAKVVELASMYYYLIKDVQQIINWFKSLPDQVMGIVKECIDQYLKGIMSTLNQIKGIASGVLGQFNSLTGDVNTDIALLDNVNTTIQSAQTTIDVISSLPSTAASNTASDILIMLNDTTDANAQNTLLNYISENFPNANVVQAQTSANIPNSTILKSSP